MSRRAKKQQWEGFAITENGVAKTLRIIGVVEIICGIILGIIIASVDEDFIFVGVIITIVSFITCMMFVGFAEIIKLLQKNADKQDAILSFLREKPVKESSAPKSVIQDIESNLPEM
jgi:uncharacterized membrane protein YkgB